MFDVFCPDLLLMLEGGFVDNQPRVKLHGTRAARYYWNRALANAATTGPICVVSLRKSDEERNKAVLLEEMKQDKQG